MNDEELREACELSGLIVEPLGGTAWGCTVRGNGRDVYSYNDDPMLPAYVASLLVARIWATRHHEGKTEIDRYLDSFDTNDCAEFFATDTQRIRAAVKVLRESEK